MNVHSIPAGWLPDAEVSKRLRGTVPPGVAALDDRARDADGEAAIATNMNNDIRPKAHRRASEHIED